MGDVRCLFLSDLCLMKGSFIIWRMHATSLDEGIVKTLIFDPNDPYVATYKTYVATDDPYVATYETYVATEDPYIATNETYVITFYQVLALNITSHTMYLLSI
ncbi:hypothetical protein H5410_051649 [Solanum commersonii]|uniref:Uncharacterized protein n=1 Tax=Solanum commersonii TaxID=4109 RepID=A0A9J5X1C6_SOLCO|nr:hypothetical protein H5410_051649 [Solanum commersonii]